MLRAISSAEACSSSARLEASCVSSATPPAAPSTLPMPPRTFSTASDEFSVSCAWSRARVSSESVPPVMTRTPSVMVLPLPPTRPRRRRRFSRVSPKLVASSPTSSSEKTRGSTLKLPCAISAANARSRCTGLATSRERKTAAAMNAASVKSATTTT